jgi:DNA (cytosine-5)-methyltransferase 1
MFTFIDLFAGIGGVRTAFEKSGGRCVFTSEIDKFAQITYAANFNTDDEVLNEDITKITSEDINNENYNENKALKEIRNNIPNHDILLGGFPCQAFSRGGKKRGFQESRGTLFFDVARILKAKQPKAFFLENVKGLVEHDKGNTFRVIKETLEELGYTIAFKVINAKNLVPQKRQRIYIVGFLTSSNIQFSFDDVIIDETYNPVLGDILHKEDGSENSEYQDENGRVLEKFVLGIKTWDYLQIHKRKHEAKGNGFGYCICGQDEVARTISARYHKDGSEILVLPEWSDIPRKLTPREAARLQGFSDDFIIPVSNTQAYKQFGNCVAVPVVAKIAKVISKKLSVK